MTNIYFVGGEVGGAGKTTFCMLLLEAYLKYSLPYHFRDADRSTPNVGWAYDSEHYVKGSVDLAANYGEKNGWKPVIFSEDLEDYSQADRLLDLAGERDVIVNLPAQVSSSFDIWLKDGNYLEQQDSLGINFVYYWVAKAEQRSIDLLFANVDKFPKMPHVLVCNQMRGTGKWEDILTQDFKAKLSAKNIKSMDMAELKLSSTERRFLDLESPKLQNLAEKGNKWFGTGSTLRCRAFIDQTIKSIVATGFFPSLPKPEEEKAPPKKTN
jgi:hypothetical protein